MNWTLDKSRPICPQICELICVSVANGEFAAGEKLPFIEEERTWQKNKLDHIWQYVYDTVREGKEYPIKSDEALAVMRVITEIKRQNGCEL